MQGMQGMQGVRMQGMQQQPNQTSVVPAGMPVNGSESIRGDNGCCCQGYNGTRTTMSSQVQVPLIIDIETDLPNGNYIESNGASGGFTCKCSAETLYSTATEMAIAKHQETLKSGEWIRKCDESTFKMTTSATVQMSGLQFKGGPANLSSAVTAGTHTLTLVQTQMRLRMIHPLPKNCCVIL